MAASSRAVNPHNLAASSSISASISFTFFACPFRGGRGRHVFLLLPELVALADAVIGVAALVAAAFKVAARDVAECGA